jgi:hypothetical protein
LWSISFREIEELGSAAALTEQATKNGFRLVETLWLRLSLMWGTGKSGQSWKLEPVLVFTQEKL